ncbi:hypothetical protein CRG98_020447 [Punica granatum]|uniref:Uncharacterized protein n=1 Tax=Punica granatum TaxID=22663 RepID=A0A2I0JSD9_PUNGR|nr:hypothetical protein CRG98_020447 [Punica granatum]
MSETQLCRYRTRYERCFLQLFTLLDKLTDENKLLGNGRGRQSRRVTLKAGDSPRIILQKTQSLFEFLFSPSFNLGSSSLSKEQLEAARGVKPELEQGRATGGRRWLLIIASLRRYSIIPARGIKSSTAGRRRRRFTASLWRALRFCGGEEI